ncbi:pilus assembly FimT family protein [Mucisphaera calidilacus]|uniref:Prepilin-type N-terminal cleavage/methylation domain-containing protein n=1 Tax=Mucisphaera calidilacus TaxID=2527982 RepID=A0A518BUE4_9BACT|nr:type II secretion system protein [Mucisphaera calidilacus]QDU70609.1 hypothetical protein Pan265_04370 [Mucisphaera calidilacus]
MTRRQHAFTLIEVLAVIVILGLLAGATAWAIVAETRTVTRDEVIDVLTRTDHTARLTARRLGQPCELRIDYERQNLRRVMLLPDGTTERAHLVTLPDSCRITPIRLPAERTRPPSTDKQVIAYATDGRSRDFGIEVAVEDESRWLVVIGMTGQTLITDDEQHAIDILLAADPGRPHAD